MSNLKDGDRVETLARLYIEGSPNGWVSAGAHGLVIGKAEVSDYLIVQVDGCPLPAYIREANLKFYDPDALEDLSFADNHCTVDYFPGNELNRPWVGINIQTYYTRYDRDYGTEEQVTGDHEFELDDMVKIRDFLNNAIEKAQKWEVDKG